MHARLAPFDPAPDFGAALQEYVAEPSERTHDLLWRHCALDLELREEMGNLWAPFAAYDIDRACLSRRAALGRMMGELGAGDSREELAAIRVPTTLVWGRHALATPIAIAERARDRFGWALEMIEDCVTTRRSSGRSEFLAVLRPLIASAAPPALDELRTRLNGRRAVRGGDTALERHDRAHARSRDPAARDR